MTTTTEKKLKIASEILNEQVADYKRTYDDLVASLVDAIAKRGASAAIEWKSTDVVQAERKYQIILELHTRLFSVWGSRLEAGQGTAISELATMIREYRQRLTERFISESLSCSTSPSTNCVEAAKREATRQMISEMYGNAFEEIIRHIQIKTAGVVA